MQVSTQLKGLGRRWAAWAVEKGAGRGVCGCWCCRMMARAGGEGEDMEQPFQAANPQRARSQDCGPPFMTELCRHDRQERGRLSRGRLGLLLAKAKASEARAGRQAGTMMLRTWQFPQSFTGRGDQKNFLASTTPGPKTA